MTYRATVVVDLAADARHARDLAGGAIFVPGCVLALNSECDLVVRGAADEVRFDARVVLHDDARGGAALELVGFCAAIRDQLAALAAGTPVTQELERVDLDDPTDYDDMIRDLGFDVPGFDDRAAQVTEVDPLFAGRAHEAQVDPRFDDARRAQVTEVDLEDDDLAIEVDDAVIHSAPPNGDRTLDEAYAGPPALDLDESTLDDELVIHAGRPPELGFEHAAHASFRHPDQLGFEDGMHPPQVDASDLLGFEDDDPGFDEAMPPGRGSQGDLARGTPSPEPALEGDETAGDPDEERQRAALTVHERLRRLTLPQQLKKAHTGELQERIVLERMYGKTVWEPLLRNPRVTAPEVARIARMGQLPKPLIEIIVGNGGWLQVPEVRRALLSNPRLATDQIMRVLRLLPKHELKLASVQTAYPHAVRDAAKRMLREG